MRTPTHTHEPNVYDGPRPVPVLVTSSSYNCASLIRSLVASSQQGKRSRTGENVFYSSPSFSYFQSSGMRGRQRVRTKGEVVSYLAAYTLQK